MNKFVSIIVLTALPLVVHAVENEALQGKRFGVEVNPLALLTFGQIFSGTFSFFDTKRDVEIALPIFHEAIGIGRSDELTRTTIDAHCRQFLGDSLNGFYVSGFARAAHLRGRTGDDPGLTSQSGGQYETVNKLVAIDFCQDINEIITSFLKNSIFTEYETSANENFKSITENILLS